MEVEVVEEDEAPLVLWVLEASPEEVGGKPVPSCTIELNGGLVDID